MAKVLKTVAVIAGVVALAAGLVVTFGIGGTAFLATAAVIASVASAVAVGASLGSQALTKPPPAQGSITQILIDPDAPQTYVMGEGYFAGSLRHDAGYGPTLNKVPNPYRGLVVDYTGGGPTESISPRVDFGTIGSYYSGFLYTDTQLGAQPEATALTPHFSGMTGWGANHKLSGQAAILWNLKFDKDGKRFASGIPKLGAYGKWVKVYDPRLDSTFPGGSGAHRIDDESTFEWSENPALHAGTYAYGRYQNGKRTIGIGLPADGIDWEVIAAWANVCDANGWSIFGVISEPGDRWANLKEICMAGAAEPVAGGKLSFRYSAPLVALDTITAEDLTEDDANVTGMQSYRDRINTIIPKYRSEANNWEIVSADSVAIPSFVAEDGEEKRIEWPFNLVKDAAQAAQLAAYRAWDSRELAPIVVVCKPRMRAYRPGECLDIDLPELGLDTPAIILKRTIDPATMKVTLTLMGETAAKHAFCLGQVAAPPPTPALGQTQEERDIVAASTADPFGYDSALISTSFVTDADPADGLLQATDTAITVEDHNRTYSDKVVSITGAVLTEDDAAVALDPSTGSAAKIYHVYYDDPGRIGGAVTLKATGTSTIAANTPTNPDRHYVGSITMDVAGGTGTTGGGSSPPGWDNDTFCVTDDTPILLADGTETAARNLAVGDMLNTRHEHTMEVGNYPVSAIGFVQAEVFACSIGDVVIRATAEHRFWIEGEWVHAKDIGKPDGTARVAKITVADAHTYISAGVLSHNIKYTAP